MTPHFIRESARSLRACGPAVSTLVGVTEVDIRTGTHTFKVDEPPALGGAGMAANPVQYALASLGSCQAITYRFWAEQLGISFDSLTVRAEGDLDIRGFRGFLGFDDTVRPGLSAVRVQVTVSRPESGGRYQELAAAADEYCPGLDLFRNPVPVSRTLFSASGSLSVPGRYHTRPCLASARMADQRVHPPVVVSWRPPRPVRPTGASAPGGVPTQFLRFTMALLAMSFAAFIFFLLLPAAPPWYAHNLGLLPGVHDLVHGALPSAVSPYFQRLDADPVAAFPSLHAAYPTLGALALWQVSRRTALVMVPWCLTVWFSVVFLGQHYVIDVTGGIILAAATWTVMTYVVTPRVRALGDRPVAVTAVPGAGAVPGVGAAGIGAGAVPRPGGEHVNPAGETLAPPEELPG